MQKKCKSCGEEFLGNPAKLYCKYTCRPKQVQVTVRTKYKSKCMVCQSAMEASDLRTKTCGKDCRKIYDRLRGHFYGEKKKSIIEG